MRNRKKKEIKFDIYIARCGAKISIDLLTIVTRAVTVVVVIVIIITLASFQCYCCCCCLRALFIFSLPVPMVLRNIRYEFSVDPDEIEPRARQHGRTIAFVPMPHFVFSTRYKINFPLLLNSNRLPTAIIFS